MLVEFLQNFDRAMLFGCRWLFYAAHTCSTCDIKLFDTEHRREKVTAKSGIQTCSLSILNLLFWPSGQVTWHWCGVTPCVHFPKACRRHLPPPVQIISTFQLKNHLFWNSAAHKWPWFWVIWLVSLVKLASWMGLFCVCTVGMFMLYASKANKKIDFKFY